MLKNYFKTAWRNLAGNKFYSAINITGLAIGLAVGIMVLMWVNDESSYDQFHSNAEQIYKINSHLGTGSSAQVWTGSPAPLAVYSKQSIPEVKEAVRIKGNGQQLLLNYGEHKFVETGSAYVDPSFFKVFDFHLKKGNAAKPFIDDQSIVITESTSKKYFGDEEAIGKTILQDGKFNFQVSGVIEDFPENSSIRYDILFPMSLFAKNFGGNGAWKTIDEDLGNFQYDIFLQLQKGASSDLVAKKVTKLYWEHRPGENPNDGFYTLQSLPSMHLVAADGNTGALQTVRIFLIVSILILLIACINYVNLSTARSMLRSKEVGVRKIIGAGRYQLFFQFIIESALLFSFASLLAFALIWLLLPLYNDLSGKHLLFSLTDKNVWWVVGCTILGTLALASIYPAIMLSSFKPIQVLKGKLSLGIGNHSFRKVLVVTQFVFSVGLIIGIIVITNQLKYVREKDLGYNREYVFSFAMTGAVHDHYDAVRNQLLQEHGVLEVASSDNGVVGTGSTTGDTDWDGKAPGTSFLIHPNSIDKDFIPLLKMQLVAGSNFTGSKSDSMHFILNETAVRQAGIKDPIGKTFTLWQTKGIITGVVKDFNFASLKQAIEPAIFYYQPPNWTIFIKTTGKDAPAAIAGATKVWKNYSAEFPFNYSFLDDQFDKLYKADQRMGALFNVFALVAIVISCLGLFGLATYTAQVKRKEIGIRKVLGASVQNITGLLAREFVVLVLIAILIASPLAGWFTHHWLQDFVYRTQLSWWMFVMAGIAALLIALITVSFQAVKAAIANPVKSLRSE